MERLTNIVIADFRKFHQALRAVWIKRSDLEHPAHRQTKVPNARLPVHLLRIRGDAVEFNYASTMSALPAVSRGNIRGSLSVVRCPLSVVCCLLSVVCEEGALLLVPCSEFKERSLATRSACLQLPDNPGERLLRLFPIGGCEVTNPSGTASPRSLRMIA